MSGPGFAGTALDLRTVVAIVLGAAALVATLRLLYRQWRAAPAQRSRSLRIALLVLAQPLCAALLYCALFPPGTAGRAGTLVVATGGATGSMLDAAAGGDTRVALPEAPPIPGMTRVPDLATALRRHPGTARLRVVGTGLTARDRDAAHGLALEFRPAPLPTGLVELIAPAEVAEGGAFRIHGRVQGLPGGAAELRNPAGRRVDRVPLPGDGRFALAATARVPGGATFGLRLRDRSGRVVEDVDLPLQVSTPPPPRVLVLAGAPGPEVKFLRRWALDAGLPMHARIDTGGGMTLGDAPIAFDAASLARFDVVVLDERAWSGLGDAQRAALAAAVRDGLGLLLRVTAAPSEAERRRLRALGFSVDGGRDAVPMRLAQPRAGEDAMRARVDAGPAAAEPPAAAPVLTRRAVRMAAGDGLPLLRADGGGPVALWRAHGRGRVAVWTLTDSYRLVLGGRADLHGELWSGAIATLARAQPRVRLVIEGEPRQGERIALCGLRRDARVSAPQGEVTRLMLDPATGARACAAYWPTTAGWHRVQSGRDAQLFHVRATRAAAGLHAHAVQEATRALALAPRIGDAAAAAAVSGPVQPGARWPWWLAWLSASAALWWLERSRLGRRG